MIVIISEKPSITCAMVSAILQKWPEHEIYALHTRFNHTISYRYPRGLSWHDYPVLNDPQFKLLTDQCWIIYRIDKSGAPHQVRFADNKLGVKTARDLLNKAESIVYACEPDPSGMLAYYRFISCLMGPVLGPEFAHRIRPAIILTSLTEDAITKSFIEITTTDNQYLQTNLSYGLCKQYFDFNFNLNSQAILTRAFIRTSQKHPTVPISKYGLQILYFLKNIGEISERDLLNSMSNWVGTGRYPIDNDRVQLGTSKSREQILQDLSSDHLIYKSKENRELFLTQSGQFFLESLHPDCEDSDLPFRLDLWCREGLEKSKPKIDRYLRTFFGKQMRFRRM